MGITVSKNKQSETEKEKQIQGDIPTYHINDTLKILYKPLSHNSPTPSKSKKGSAAFDGGTAVMTFEEDRWRYYRTRQMELDIV